MASAFGVTPSPTTRLRLFDTRRVLGVSVLTLGALIALWTWSVRRSAERQTANLLAVQAEMLLRTHQADLNRGDVRSAVEGLGAALPDLRVEVTAGGREPLVAIGPTPARPVCRQLPLVAGNFAGDLNLCRSAPEPPGLALRAAGLGVCLAAVLAAALLWLEADARRGIARLLAEAGIQGHEPRTMLRDVNAAVAALGEARARERQLAAEAAVGRSAQILAHDVRRPLALLDIGLAMLNKARSEGELRRSAAGLTQRLTQARRDVDGLVNDVLAAGRPPRLVRAPLSVRALLNEAAADTRLMSTITPTELSCRHRYQALGDADRLRRVIANLLDNAVAAAGGNGRVQLCSEDAVTGDGDRRVRIAIVNTGSYVPPEVRESLFTAFVSRRRGGTGLGLAIARQVVEAHGTSLWCESEPGDAERPPATTFLFELPATELLD